MSDVVYQWHPEVVADFAALPTDLRKAYLEHVEALKTDPKIGEHLSVHASTGDLSDYRKLKFGHDTPRGPSHRIVYIYALVRAAVGSQELSRTGGDAVGPAFVGSACAHARDVTPCRQASCRSDFSHRRCVKTPLSSSTTITTEGRR